MSKKPARATKPKGDYILAMHLPGDQLFIQKYPTRWKDETVATLAAREKAAKYGRHFSVLKFIGTTRIPPRAVQFDLFY